MKDALLWKRILHEGVVHASGRPDTRLETIRNDIAVSPIIHDSRPNTAGGRQWDSFSGIAPPFIRFWWEGRDLCSAAMVGALVFARDEDDGQSHLRGLAIMAGKRGPTVAGQFHFVLSKDGTINNPEVYIGPDTISAVSDHDVKALHTIVGGAGSLLLDTLEMLSCKNVSLEAREQDAKQVRIATKRHGPSATGYRYHVLVVRTPGARSDAPAQEIGNMPRHVCRGHYAEYGPEFNKGLLFGKHAGRFYVPPHLKGDAKNGIVEKDYAIKASHPAK